jgi:hypothetical protein
MMNRPPFDIIKLKKSATSLNMLEQAVNLLMKVIDAIIITIVSKYMINVSKSLNL